MKEMWFPLGMLILKKKLYDATRPTKSPHWFALFHRQYHYSTMTIIEVTAHRCSIKTFFRQKIIFLRKRPAYESF